MPRWGFPALIALALALALGLVLSILGSQLGFVAGHAPLRVLAQPEIRHALLLSLTTATGAAGLAVLLAVPAAYGLVRFPFPGSKAADVLLDVPVILSPVALGVSLLLFFRSSPGQWIESHLLRFVFEVPGILLAQFTVALALSIRVLKAAFEQVDPRYEQVARFLGCTAHGAFARVTFPLIRKPLIAAFILAWARSVGEFGATVTLAGAVAGKTETIPAAIYLRMAEVNIEEAVALILVLSGLSLMVLIGIRLLGGRR
jgi:molybdate transport system permease protein